MAKHWHMIYTPKGLLDLKREAVPYAKMSASAEMGQGGRHWHIYLITEDSERTIRDRLKDIQQIPKVSRGKKSLHYSLREIDPHNPEYPEDDLRKFTLGYTLKNQNIDNFLKEDHFHEDYTQEELKDAYDYYQEQSAKTYKPPEPVSEQRMEELRNIPDGINGEWADYMVYMDKQLKPIMLANTARGYAAAAVPVEFIRSHSRKFWREKNNGLFPQASKFRRFLASIADKYRSIFRVEDRRQLMKDCGY